MEPQSKRECMGRSALVFDLILTQGYLGWYEVCEAKPGEVHIIVRGLGHYYPSQVERIEEIVLNILKKRDKQADTLLGPGSSRPYQRHDKARSNMTP